MPLLFCQALHVNSTSETKGTMLVCDSFRVRECARKSKEQSPSQGWLRFWWVKVCHRTLTEAAQKPGNKISLHNIPKQTDLLLLWITQRILTSPNSNWIYFHVSPFEIIKCMDTTAQALKCKVKQLLNIIWFVSVYQPIVTHVGVPFTQYIKVTGEKIILSIKLCYINTHQIVL